jgi:hypothetical protein
VLVDGFNRLITIEAALSGGALLLCRDGCLRDLASVHGSYRSVQETDEAIRIAGEVLGDLGPAAVSWLRDSPVSNSVRRRPGSGPPPAGAAGHGRSISSSTRTGLSWRARTSS